MKKKLLAIGAAIMAALGAVFAVLTFGRFRKQPSPLAPRPTPPPLPDVEADDAPEVDTEFNDSPADDFKKLKDEHEEPESDEELFDQINSKFDK